MSNLLRLLLFLSLISCQTGCSYGPGTLAPAAIYSVPAEAGLPDGRHVPVPEFLVLDPGKEFNRIGMPAVRRLQNGGREIIVDPFGAAALFVEEQSFHTGRGRYTNLVYRIHFQRVPYFNLTAGNNPGLLVIYTLDSSDTLVLVTTVHTCGCYLAFFPTQALAPGALPGDWPRGTQWVYGYRLPALLTLPDRQAKERIFFTLASETHRVAGVTVAANPPDGTIVEQVDLRVYPMEHLFVLPAGNETASFFETDGPRRGYVRNNIKPLERLFLGWLALDLRVGEDKAYGGGDGSDTIFYTSLKFWNRKASDMKDFPRFLAFWGWNL